MFVSRTWSASLFCAVCATALGLTLAACSSSSPAAPAADAPDAGPPADLDAGDASSEGGPAVATYPAVPFQLPTATSLGGPVLKAPTLVPIVFANDPDGATLTAHVQAFVASSEWPTMVGEFGVGAGTVTPLVLPDAAPATLDDLDVVALLESHLAGDHPGWPAPTASTVFVVYAPASTQVTDKGQRGCDAFNGYHGEVAVATAAGSVNIPYAVAARCPASPLGSSLDTAAWSSTHEILETVTDPFPRTAPAYHEVDEATSPWTLFTSGGEIADLCYLDAPALEPTSKHLLARSYSNVAAKAGHDPCIPAGEGESGPFFQAVPVLPDAVTFLYKSVEHHVRGVKIPVGGTGVVELALASGGPTAAWQVELLDLAEFMGAAPHLHFTLDRASGKNGDKLHVTIKVLSKDTDHDAEPFIIASTLGGTVTYTMAVVGN